MDPTDTVLVSPFVAWGAESFAVEIINDDGAQTLDAYVETSSAQAGPWSRHDTAELTAIGPGDARNRVFDTDQHRWIRVVGVASGLGLSARVACWFGVG